MRIKLTKDEYPYLWIEFGRKGFGYTNRYNCQTIGLGFVYVGIWRY
jgi:hypothetical protein